MAVELVERRARDKSRSKQKIEEVFDRFAFGVEESTLDKRGRDAKTRKLSLPDITDLVTG